MEGATAANRSEPDLGNPSHDETSKPPQKHHLCLDEIDSSCSTPLVSPGRVGFFYSAPASPMHFLLSSFEPKKPEAPADLAASVSVSFEFDFSAHRRCGSPGDNNNNNNNGSPSMCSADELFFNGQIRPMKLSTHLQRPQVLAPLIEDHHDSAVKAEAVRGRDLRLRDRSLRRRTRSMSPFRTSSPFPWQSDDVFDGANFGEENSKEGEITVEESGGEEKKEKEAESSTPSMSASSSRSSSAGRNSKRWVFLKDFLYRSKSEGRGRSSGTKFWSSATFSSSSSSAKDVVSAVPLKKTTAAAAGGKEPSKKTAGGGGKLLANGVGKRRVPPPSPHEIHYTKNRAQAEEMRKKTFLPYRQGLLGCLGFSSKSYGAINGFARALNPVSSR